MKMFKIFLIMVVGSIMTSCYNDFETPSPEPSGRVIGQSLVAGTLVEQGTKITVYVATESDP